MSKFSKNPLKAKKVKLNEPPTPPRPLADIQKEYQELAFKAGQLQYQQYVNTRDLEQTNTRLISVNQEAAARLELDKKAAAETAKTENTETKPEGAANV